MRVISDYSSATPCYLERGPEVLQQDQQVAVQPTCCAVTCFRLLVGLYQRGLGPYLDDMRRSALVLCEDASSLRILTGALNEVGVEPLVRRTSHETMEAVLEGNCTVLIVDFDLPGAAEVAKMVSLLVPPQRPVLLAMATTWTTAGQAFQAKPKAILYKPLDMAQVKDALATCQKSMKSERRRSARHRMKALVYLQFESGTLPAIGIDVSEHGLALHAADTVPIRSNVSVRFVLPGTNHTVQGLADVVWADDKGRAGMFFSRLTPTARKHLKQWLHKQSVNTKDAVRVLLPPANAACMADSE